MFPHSIFINTSCWLSFLCLVLPIPTTPPSPCKFRRPVFPPLNVWRNTLCVWIMLVLGDIGYYRRTVLRSLWLISRKKWWFTLKFHVRDSDYWFQSLGWSPREANRSLFYTHSVFSTDSLHIQRMDVMAWWAMVPCRSSTVRCNCGTLIASPEIVRIMGFLYTLGFSGDYTSIWISSTTYIFSM